MLLKSARDQCILRILENLIKKEASYSYLFKITKVSHVTIQKSLKDLTENKFIEKVDLGYKITEKGLELSEKLNELRLLINNINPSVP